MPYQHSVLKRTLVGLKGCKPELNENRKTQIQEGIQNLTKLQNLVETALQKGSLDTLSRAKMNAKLSVLDTALAEMRTEIQNQLQVL